MANQVLYIDLPLSESEAGGNYRYGSSVVTPWISQGFLDVAKRFMTMKLYTENLSATDKIEGFYQLETGDLNSGWTAISTLFSTSPFQSITMDSTTYAISGRRIRFKFMIRNTDPTTTVKFRSWLLGSLLVLTIRYSYDLRVRLADSDTDMQGKKHYNVTAASLQTQLDAWAASPPTILTMTSIYDLADKKTVIVLPFPVKPIKQKLSDGTEIHYANVQFIEAI